MNRSTVRRCDSGVSKRKCHNVGTLCVVLLDFNAPMYSLSALRIANLKSGTLIHGKSTNEQEP